MYMIIIIELDSNWILTSCQPHRVTSGQSERWNCPETWNPTVCAVILHVIKYNASECLWTIFKTFSLMMLATFLTSTSSFISTCQYSQCPSDTDVFHFMSEKMLRVSLTDWKNLVSLRRSMAQLYGSARLLLCRKLMEGVRLCTDMLEPNKATKREKHIMPTLNDLISDLNSSTVFNKLDSSSAYHQLEPDKASCQVTAFTTCAGIWCQERSLFGVNAAAEIFQKATAETLSDIPGVQNLSDDIIMEDSSRTWHQSLSNTEEAWRERR